MSNPPTVKNRARGFNVLVFNTTRVYARIQYVGSKGVSVLFLPHTLPRSPSPQQEHLLRAFDAPRRGPECDQQAQVHAFALRRPPRQRQHRENFNPIR